MNIRTMLTAGLLTALAGGDVRAQQIVHDPLNFVQLVAELKQLRDSYVVLQSSYQQLEYTVESLKHPNAQSLETAAGLLTNRLPGSPAGDIPAVAFGSQLSAAGRQFYDRNTVYAPPGDDFAAAEMRRRATATANLQGESQAAMDRIARRTAGLTELQNSIPEQPDVQATAGLAARLQSENTFLAAEQNHLAALRMTAAMQESVDRNRVWENSQKILDERAAAADAHWTN